MDGVLEDGVGTVFLENGWGSFAFALHLPGNRLMGKVLPSRRL